MSIEEKVLSFFPNALPVPDYFGYAKRISEHHGFRDPNTIGGIATCADELERPLEEYCYDVWGEAFRLGALAGFPNVGISDIEALRHHAPNQEKLGVFYFPHLGFSAEGQLGLARRHGHLHDTPSCGSLSKLLDEFLAAHNAGEVFALPDRDEDPNQFAVAATLLPEMDDVLAAQHPIRDITERCVLAGMARFLSLLEDQPNEFIIFAGIHLNTPPSEEDYIVPVFGILGTSGKIIETGEDAYYDGADLLAMMNEF
ncbi:MAG: hypothetical protein E3J72_14810 [Planctomycetota bacterium]|nr:MAG: hypothetical protein E3J72_14810 [Planctomycetota bacterium]